MRSSASWNSGMPMSFLFRRAARIAASLTRLARSAPEKPGDCLATSSTENALSSGLPFECTRRISTRPFMSGRSRITWRSKRPGRRSAGSRTSGRLVAATTITFVAVSKPSISTRIWLSVCSRSSWEPPRPAPRWRPTASISSTKTMQGALRLAWSNRSRTRLAPTPTNISTNSEPEIEKNGTPASPATARASMVLPVPGGPTRSTPRGIRAPSELNFSGYLRNSTTSWSSVLASSTPATSAKVTTVLLPRNMRARLLPNESAWLLVPWACRIMKKRKPPIRRTGRRAPTRRLTHWPASDAFMAVKTILFGSCPPAFAASTVSWNALWTPIPGTTEVYFEAGLPVVVTVSVRSCWVTFVTRPARTSAR